MPFANVRNEEILDFNSLYLNEDITRIETTEEIYNAYMENKNKVLYDNGEIVLNPNFDEEQVAQKRETKLIENTNKAKEAVENGYVEYKEAEFETNAQTVSDLTATMLLMQATGVESYDWLSKDDKVVTLTLEDFGILGGLIADFKNAIWSVKYLYYKNLIEQATTASELDSIIIDYDIDINAEEIGE